MVTQIEQMLVEAWEKFCDYYDTKAPRYQDSWPTPLDRTGALKSHWICWDEYDLTFHIGRFFYDILKGKKESLFSNIEIHFEKPLVPNQFRDYVFETENCLDTLRIRLIENGVLNTGHPNVDLIVAYENRPYCFLLCAEVKCFRGYVPDPIDVINKDIKKLMEIRDLEIAKKVVFILFDDYYWCNDEKTANTIQQRLDKIRNENGITVLFHTSEAKLENY
jgi:hypothetical protein